MSLMKEGLVLAMLSVSFSRYLSNTITLESNTVSRSGNTVTVQTANAHGINSCERIVLKGADDTYDFESHLAPLAAEQPQRRCRRAGGDGGEGTVHRWEGEGRRTEVHGVHI